MSEKDKGTSILSHSKREMSRKFSVIIPCYNCEKTIEHCIGSIPDNGAFEIIAINDCSTDGTARCLDACRSRIKNNCIIVLTNSENKGAGNTRNAGFEYVTGEYLVFLDADDLFTDDFYDSVMAVLQYKSYDCISFNVVTRQDDKDKLLSMYFCRQIKEGEVDKHSATVYMRGCTWGKIFRSSLVIENRILFADIPVSEDQVFIRRAIVHCSSIWHIDRPLYVYRHMPDSLMHCGKYQFAENDMKAFLLIKEDIGDICPDELNSIYFLEIVYGSTVSYLKSGMNGKECRKHFNEVVKQYDTSDKYYHGYEWKYRFVYRMFRKGVFSIFKLVLKLT